MNALEDIAEARSALDAGHNREAARRLNRATLETLDPELLTEIRELAVKGRGGAGPLRRRLVWDHIIDETEVRGRRPQG